MTGKKSVCLLSFISAIFIFCLAVNSFAYEKEKIAVLSLEMGVPGMPEEATKSMDDMFVTALVKTKMFDVIERSQINRVMQEQNFQNKVVDESSAAELGKLLGANKIIVGTISKMDVKDTNAILVRVKQAVVEIQARVVNVETGSIDFADSFTGTKNIVGLQGQDHLGREVSVAGSNNIGLSDFAAAANEAINKIVNKMIYDIDFIGEIIQLEGEDYALIDIAKDTGIKPTEIVKVIALKSIPTAKKTIVKKETIGELIVVEVDADYSKAKIDKGKGVVKVGDKVLYKKAQLSKD